MKLFKYSNSGGSCAGNATFYMKLFKESLDHSTIRGGSCS